MNRTFVSLGGALAFLAVAFGAFGAHALRERIGPESLQIWHTGVEYQMAHALALILIGVLSAHVPDPRVKTSGWLLYFGVLIFSGSLYILAVSGIRWLGAITPLGGACFLAGWALLVWTVAKAKPAV